MKKIKKLSMCIVAIVVLAVSGYNVKMSMDSTTDALSATAMLNLAALANDENGGGNKESGGGSSNDQPDPNKWTRRVFDCFNSRGQVTGQQITCSRTGFLDNCAEKRCP
jgi:hypothetical protein